MTRPTPLRVMLLALTAGLLAVVPVRSQQPRVPAVVDYLAGANIYLRAGTSQGIFATDTLSVAASANGEALGRFIVVSATAKRAVVTFLGNPFPVTRGTTVYVAPGRAESAAGRPADAPVLPARTSVRDRGPSFHGRLSLEADAFESETRWQSTEPESVRRRFATPSLGLRAVAADLPGGLRFNTNLRMLYRYSDPQLVDPRWIGQLYQASLSKAFAGPSLAVDVGRFSNPYAGGGVWDGLMLHVGGHGLGFGVAAGFEPRRGDQSASADLPKYAAFVTYDAGSGVVRYASDASVQYLQPRHGLPTHWNAGWSQVLRIDGLRLGTDFQLDQHPATDKPILTRANASVSIPLVTGLDLRGRLSRFEPYSYWVSAPTLTFRRDQGNVGLFLWRPGGSFHLDVTAARLSGGVVHYAYSGGFSVVHTPILALDLDASATYWVQGASSAWYGAGGLARSVGPLLARASYQLYRADDKALQSVSHTGAVALSFPLAPHVSATVQGRMQRGANLRTTGLFASVWTAF